MKNSMENIDQIPGCHLRRYTVRNDSGAEIRYCIFLHVLPLLEIKTGD